MSGIPNNKVMANRRATAARAYGYRNYRRRATLLDGLESRILLSVNVTMSHYDHSLTGANTNETVLTPANVNQNNFGKLFGYNVDGNVYTQPLVMTGVTLSDKSVHDLVFVGTEHDSMYAFDANSNAGANANPIWHDSFFNTAAGVTSVPYTDVGSNDISPEIGITGTPVIDASTNTLYVVVKTKEVSGSTTTYVQRLHALDIATGAEKFGGPVIIQGSVPGTGQGTDGKGNVPFNAKIENQRSALTLSNGVVYIAWASHGDVGPYHGWVMGYNASTLKQVAIFNDSPNADRSGIWMAGAAPAIDAQGNMYVVSGNGTFDINTGGVDYGDSFIKLNTSAINPNSSTVQQIQVLSYFSPHNTSSLDQGDIDQGSAGSVLLPSTVGSAAHPNLLVQAGKSGIIWLLDTSSLGGYNATTDNVVQQISGAVQGPRTTAAYFNGNLYWHGSGGGSTDYLRKFTISNGQLSTKSVDQATTDLSHFPGADPIISANGVSNAIAWEVQVDGFNTAGTQAILRAFDANNLSNELYDSNLNATRDAPGLPIKFTVPTVANGKVYVPTQSGLAVYGLLNGSTQFNVNITSPMNNANFTMGANILIQASVVDTAAAVTKVDFYQGTTYLGTSTTSPYSFTWNNVPAGGFSLTAVATDATNATSTSAPIHINVAQPSTLPAPWSDADIGAVGLAGTASAMNGVFSITGAGADIWGTADAFNYAYQSMTGDGQIIAHVDSVQNTSSWAKAGVMIRNTLDANSAHADMLITPGNGATFQRRRTAGATSTSTKLAGIKAPEWVKLVRSNNIFSGYISPDGNNWTLVGTDTIAMGATVYVGLAVTAHNATKLNTSTFDSIAINASPVPGALPAPWTDADLGSPGQPGSASYNAGVFTVNGSGGDIWNTSDQFNYVYQPVTGDSEIVAHVESVGNTDPWAKAGVMIRETLDPASTFADVLITPGHGAALQARLAAGTSAVHTPGPAVTAPYWVKLDRIGNVFTGYISADGATWATLGSYTIPMAANVYIGLAVTSHNNTLTCAATFDRVSLLNQNYDLQINAGGSAAGNYLADANFFGGATSATSHAIDTSLISGTVAPQAVYQSERYGNFNYVITGLRPGDPFEVTLSFAEIYWTAVGQRIFNVTINGVPFLTNFDIFATAGGGNKAIAELAKVNADTNGQITIQFTSVVDNAQLVGLEVTPSS